MLVEPNVRFALTCVGSDWFTISIVVDVVEVSKTHEINISSKRAH